MTISYYAMLFCFVTFVFIEGNGLEDYLNINISINLPKIYFYLSILIFYYRFFLICPHDKKDISYYDDVFFAGIVFLQFSIVSYAVESAFRIG
jgi:hypothetical protein